MSWAAATLRRTGVDETAACYTRAAMLLAVPSWPECSRVLALSSGTLWAICFAVVSSGCDSSPPARLRQARQ